MKSTAANIVVLACGGLLTAAVIGSIGTTRHAMGLDSSLEQVQAATEQGQPDTVARQALDILIEQPRSWRALRQFLCTAWNAEYYDDAAETLQRYTRFGVTPESFDDCTRGNTMSGALVVVGTPSLRDPRQVVVRDGIRGGAAKPTVKEVLQEATSPEGVWLGLACRNLRSGMPQLAESQLALARGHLGSIDSTSASLPKTWGCGEMTELD